MPFPHFIVAIAQLFSLVIFYKISNFMISLHAVRSSKLYYFCYTGKNRTAIKIVPKGGKIPCPAHGMFIINRPVIVTIDLCVHNLAKIDYAF